MVKFSKIYFMQIVTLIEHYASVNILYDHQIVVSRFARFGMC